MSHFVKLGFLFFVTLVTHNICMAEKLGFTYFGTLSKNSTTGVGRSTQGRESSVYYISNSASTWGDAWFTCLEGFKGSLLAVETSEENTFIRNLMLKENKQTVWTSGAFDAFSGAWKWASNGQNIAYGSWGPGQPYGNSSLARVVILNDMFNNLWITGDATTNHYSICEMDGPTVTTTTPLIPTTTKGNPCKLK